MTGLRKAVVQVLLAALVFLVTACTTPAQVGRPSPVGQFVRHSFSFDLTYAEPKVVVMDYRYGAGEVVGTSMAKYMLKADKPVVATNVYGTMRVGDELYVRWKVIASGETYTQLVDLKPLLPADMGEKRIAFDIKGDQLFVYVVYPEKRPPNVAANGPDLYRRYLVKTMYPYHDRTIQ